MQEVIKESRKKYEISSIHVRIASRALAAMY